MSLPSFDLIIPKTLVEAAAFLGVHKNATRIIAGGTDLIPSLKQKLFEPAYLLDIKGLPELGGVRELPDGSLRIGALTTISDLAANRLLHTEYPVLSAAASTVAGPNLRNVGTVGGNLCLDTRCYWYNQSYFWRQSCNFCIKKDGTLCHVAPGSKQCWAVYSGDMAPALMTLGALVKLVSVAGSRSVPLTEFFVNDGLVRNVMRPEEILSEVLVPSTYRGCAGAYDKFRVRGSVDYPLAGVAVVARRSNNRIQDLRVALTAVNPRPVLLSDPLGGAAALDPAVVDGIRKLVLRTAKPLKTSASTMDYRRHMLGIMLERSLERVGNTDV